MDYEVKGLKQRSTKKGTNQGNFVFKWRTQDSFPNSDLLSFNYTGPLCSSRSKLGPTFYMKVYLVFTNTIIKCNIVLCLKCM